LEWAEGTCDEFAVHFGGKSVLFEFWVAIVDDSAIEYGSSKSEANS
jgi:hypothetical protein